MLSENAGLSHRPPMSWTCYTPAGAESAGRSNISTAPGVRAVDFYMVDGGSTTHFGHRRWILNSTVDTIGLGSTDFGPSCMDLIGGSGSSEHLWIAWPPPGVFPEEALSTVNRSGWTIQSNEFSFESAGVSVTSGGMTLPITVAPLLLNLGSIYAVSFVPDGWTPQAGRTYRVTVSGTTVPIEYDIQVEACP